MRMDTVMIKSKSKTGFRKIFAITAAAAVIAICGATAASANDGMGYQSDYNYYYPGARSTYNVYVQSGYLALRTEPAYKYENEIGQLYNGDEVSVIDKSYGTYWYVYSPKYDTYGYVNSNYLY